MTLAQSASAIFTMLLCTTDGVESSITCATQTTVLEAAAAAGMVLPSICQTGSCGACAAEVVEGRFELGSHSAEALGHRSAPGATLLCRTYPRSDCRIRLPYDSARIGDSLPAERSATITALEIVTPSTVRLALALERDEQGSCSAEFDPGQFVQLQVPGREDRRAYSLANTANWDGALEFFIRLQPGGYFSTYLTETAAVGERLIVIGPQGAFGLHEHGLRPRWFVGGGSGITPLLSMLRRMAEWGDPQPARLYAGFNDEDDVFATTQIEELLAAMPELTLEICLWRPANPTGWRGFTGTPPEAVKRDLAGIDEPPDVYVCGPPALAEATEQALLLNNVPAEQIFVERITAN